MASSSSSSVSDNLNDSSTQKIFDYCKKYSQNANLLKYFSGSSVQYLPVIAMSTERKDQHKDKINLPAVTFSTDEKASVSSKGHENACISKKNFERNSSNDLLESPSDIKKLEWDNGADIGYNISGNNIERRVLCKCVSLPILANLTDGKFKLNAPHLKTLSVSDSAKVLCSSTPSNSIPSSVLSSDESLNHEFKSCAQSRSCTNKIRTSQESLSESGSEESKLIDFKKTLSYLKEKIGLPVAHSSPNIENINDIPEFKRTVSSTHQKLNKKEQKRKVELGANNLSLPCVVTTEAVAVQKEGQPLFSKNNPDNEPFSFINIEKSGNIPKPILNKSNKKVIELTISKPITLDWTSSDLLVEKNKIGLSFKSHVVSMEGNFHQPQSTEDLNTDCKSIPINYSKSKAVNISKEYSNCSSNCDSFEYIDNAVNIKSTRDPKTQQRSKNNNSSVGGNPNHLNLSSVDDPQDKESCSSICGSKSFSKDIETQIDILQKLLKSKGVHLNKKKYIKKLIKSICDDKCRVEDPDSSPGACSSNNENSLKDCPVFSKDSSKMSSDRTIEKNTISSSEASCTNTRKSSTVTQDNPDYLLQFAENERAYQINWIENEISHLTKLKNILELKNRRNYKRKANQTPSQIQPTKTCTYKITQQDSNSNESEREYIIKTKLDISTSQPINYCFQGKKYSITDDLVPSTNTISNNKFPEKCVSADIKIEAKDKQTSITVSAPCLCKGNSCYCELDTSEGLEINKHGQLICSVPETASKICPVCKEFKCICQEEPIRPLESPAIPETDSPENSNSLQKIFQKCSCTVDNKACHCVFVKKLLNHLLSNKDGFSKDVSSSSSSEVKTESLFKTNSNGLLPPNNKHKEQLTNQPLSDLQLEMPETDRNTPTLKPIFDERLTTESNDNGSHLLNDRDSVKKQDVAVEDYKLIQPSSIDKIGTGNINLTESMSANIIEVDHTVRTSYITNILSQNIRMDSATNILNQTEPVIDKTANNEDGIKIVDNPALKTDTKYENGSIVKIEESNSVSKSNSLHKDASVQALLNFLKETGPSDMLSTINNNKKYNDVGVQAFGRLLTGKEHSNKQDKTSNTDELKNENDNIVHSDQIGNTKCKDSNIQVNVSLLPEIEDNTRIGGTNREIPSKNISEYADIGVQHHVKSMTNTQQPNKNKTTSTEDNMIRPRNKEINLASESTNMHENNGEQASAGSNTHLSKRNHQLPTQKESLVDESDKNVDVDMDKDVRNNGSKLMTPGNSKRSNNPSRISKKEATSNDTLANYSQEGSTNESISTSVFDSESLTSTRIKCVYCNKRTFVAEVYYIQNGNVAYAVCCRCYCNSYYYHHYHQYHNVCNLHHRHITCPKLLEVGHTSQHQSCKCCKPKLRKGAVIPQGMTYSIILEEPRTKKKKARSTKENLNEFNSKNRPNENNKENVYKNKNNLHADPYDNDQRNGKKSGNNNLPHPEELKENEPQYALTDYLQMNRPQFIYSAEYRRQFVLNSRILRERQKDSLKLHFLENNLNITDKGQYKLFTESEMRNITKKNYQKLPETQNKLTSLREKRLRDADKLIRNKFAKNVQMAALKGHWNFPIDKAVTDYAGDRNFWFNA